MIRKAVLVEILKELQRHPPQFKIVLQPTNMGKGVALRRAIQEATGLYHDAVLKYDPSEFPSPSVWLEERTLRIMPQFVEPLLQRNNREPSYLKGFGLTREPEGFHV